jgi:Uma2 family endonuclease
MIAHPRERISAAEFLQRPESNRLVQLIDGEIIDVGCPPPSHQLIVGETLFYLSPHVKLRSGHAFSAPLDVELDDGNVVQPDVIVLLPDSKCDIGKTRLHGAPDLVIEVLSPGTTKIDRRDKFRLYERHGVREYWMLELSEPLVEVWMLQDGRFVLLDVYGKDETFTSPLLSTIEVDRLFPA